MQYIDTQSGILPPGRVGVVYRLVSVGLVTSRNSVAVLGVSL